MNIFFPLTVQPPSPALVCAAAFSPFREFRGEWTESEEVRGKLGGQKRYEKAPCPLLGFYDAA